MSNKQFIEATYEQIKNMSVTEQADYLKGITNMSATEQEDYLKKLTDEQFKNMSATEQRDYLERFSTRLDNMWWSQKPGRGYCGCCGKYGGLRVSDSGLYCNNC